AQPKPAPDPTDRVALGRYLATGALDCYACHSADFKKMDQLHPEKSEGFFGGGNMLRDFSGREVYAPNLTFDRATGIAAWSERDFVRALKRGVRPDGRALQYPMALYADLSDHEIGAIYDYLKTVPVIKKPAVATRTAATNEGSPGRKV